MKTESSYRHEFQQAADDDEKERNDCDGPVDYEGDERKRLVTLVGVYTNVRDVIHVTFCDKNTRQNRSVVYHSSSYLRNS